MSRPSDFLATLVTATVKFGVLACTLLLSLPEHEKKQRLNSVTLRAEAAVQNEPRKDSRLTLDLFLSCVIVAIHQLSALAYERALFISSPNFATEKVLDPQNSITSSSERCNCAAICGISVAISLGTLMIPC